MTRRSCWLPRPRRWGGGGLSRLLLPVLALLAPGWGGAQTPSASVPPRVLRALRDTVAARYVRPIAAESLARFASAESLLGALQDRYTVLLSPEARREFEVQAGAAFGGIGARLGLRRDTTFIASVQPGSPAARARLRPFDRIVAVDGRPVAGLPIDSIVALIRGPVGTPIGLGLRRGLAGALIQAVLIRAPVQIPSVPAGAILPDGIGVVRLAQFGPGATREVVNALDWMVQGGVRAVIIDLRGNPGGVLAEALETAQLFLPRGTDLVEVRGRPGTPVERPRTAARPRYPTLPVALLLDEQSASAAEVLAGALQDAGRATVAGRQSFGKGSVQQILDLPEEWAVKLTTARWFTPRGRQIDRGPPGADRAMDPAAPHEGGILPDLVFPPDTAPALVARAALAAGARWDSLNLAILDWIEAAGDTLPGITQEFEVDPLQVRAVVERAGLAGHLPPGTDSAVAGWVASALSRGAVGARLGVMEEGAWALMHDPEIRHLAQRLACGGKEAGSAF